MAGYFEKMLTRRLSYLQEQANIAADRAAKEVGKEADKYAFDSVVPELEEALKVAYWDATSTWYRAYIPKKYTRTHSFYNMLEIESPGDMTFGWEYRDQDMFKPSWGGGSYNVYGAVFDGGAHGGPVYGRRPVRTASITKLLEKATPEIQDFIQGKMDALGQEYFDAHFSDRCNEILRELI